MSEQKKIENFEEKIISYPKRYFKTVASVHVLISLLLLIAISIFANKEMKRSIIIDTKNHLGIIENYLISSYQTPPKICESLFFKNSQYRVTLIERDGNVICDNKKSHENMDSHHTRPEIKEAFEKGDGSSSRYSKTLSEEHVYHAKRFTYGQTDYVLRLSITLNGISDTLSRIENVIILIFTPIFIIFSLLIIYFSIKLNFPIKAAINRLNKIKKFAHLDQFETVVGRGDEWSLIENTLIQTEKKIKDYTNEIYLENEKLNKVLRSISDPIVAINEKENILFVNTPFKDIFDKKGLDNKKERKLISVLRDLDGLEFFEECLKHGKTVRSNNHIIKPVKEGETLYFDLAVTPLKGPQKEIVGAVGIFRNITDTKKNAQIREEFVTNVGHEVKTPLTAMKGYFQILKGQTKESNADTLELFNKIERNIDRLGNLFSDILNLSVIESKSNIDKEVIDTQLLTSNVISNIKQTYPDKKINIQTSFEQKQVYAHPLWLEQILTNLVDNAVKYGGGSGTITISWSSEDNSSILKVKDEGAGIAEEHLPRLFERFYRADASRSRELGGTGLGLAIVKHIVNKHKGNIKVSSQLGKGTEFVISLPKK